jgi:hypothetical protein
MGNPETTAVIGTGTPTRRSIWLTVALSVLAVIVL